MAYATFAPVPRPRTSSPKTTVKETSNSFGDNYEQTILDGINCVTASQLELTWPVLTAAQNAAIVSFFNTNAGKVFTWALPGKTSQKWRCSEWSEDYTAGVCSLSATLREVVI